MSIINHRFCHIPHRKYCYTISFFVALTLAQLIIFDSRVEALELQVESISSNPGETVTINVNVADYDQEQIAAAVFTLTYNSDYLSLISVDSNFFDSFINQWDLLNPGPDPSPDTSVVVDGQTFSKPLIHNTVGSSSSTKTMVAGVRVKAGAPSTLFSFTFVIDSSSPSAIYPISIQPTMINNTHAGYSLGGETIPILTDSIEGETDLSVAFPSYSPSIVNGTIVVEEIFVDSDSDGIEDSWEMNYFGNLTTATSISDFDKDGYTDLQEYLNSVANETDPEGASYDPKVFNAPGGIGYNPPRNSSAFWNLMLPAILNAAH